MEKPYYTMTLYVVEYRVTIVYSEDSLPSGGVHDLANFFPKRLLVQPLLGDFAPHR